jgi:hypothetical protein
MKTKKEKVININWRYYLKLYIYNDILLTYFKTQVLVMFKLTFSLLNTNYYPAEIEN